LIGRLVETFLHVLHILCIYTQNCVFLSCDCFKQKLLKTMPDFT
jgi:hypothetical protein